VAAALIWLLPRALGTSWNPVRAVLGALSVRDLALLTVLWLVGLLSYSAVLTSSLPGLSTRRAMLLNLTGSAVANVAPFGGAAGVGLNLAMTRSWRFSTASFATFTAVSNLWNWLGKLVLAVLVLGSLMLGDSLPAGALLTALRVALLVVTGVLLAAVSTLAVPAGAALLGGLLDRAVWFRPTTFATSVPAVRLATVSVVRRRWVHLTGGMAGYLALQAVLLGTCLHLLGSVLAVPVVLAGFAAERLITLVPVTPGGAGLADTACAGVLVALGGDPVIVAAAVVLYRGFTYLLEIPVGGLGILGWILIRRRQQAT
jgi:putative heme transporter